jgi:hypothetical protein
MRINNKLIDLHYLALQALGQKPEKKSLFFYKGYSEFIEDFFELLNDCSRFIADPDNNHEADLSVIMEITQVTLEHNSSTYSDEEKNEYWIGAKLASEESFRILELAFEAPTINSEVA